MERDFVSLLVRESIMIGAVASIATIGLMTAATVARTAPAITPMMVSLRSDSEL